MVAWGEGSAFGSSCMEEGEKKRGRSTSCFLHRRLYDNPNLWPLVRPREQARREFNRETGEGGGWWLREAGREPVREWVSERERESEGGVTGLRCIQRRKSERGSF